MLYRRLYLENRDPHNNGKCMEIVWCWETVYLASSTQLINFNRGRIDMFKVRYPIMDAVLNIQLILTIRKLDCEKSSYFPQLLRGSEKKTEIN